MPTRIFPVSILPGDLLVTHQRSHTWRLTQIVTQFHVAAVEQMLFRFAQRRYRNYSRNAGWSSLVARQAHNLKAAGSNPAPATNFLEAAVPYRVYVIQNPEGKFYVGLSDDVGRRIGQHNVGDSEWTRGKGPWILIWQSEEMNLSDARKLELLLKRQKGGDGFYKLIGLSRFGS